MQIRPYKESDKEFIVSLAIRFTEFNLMSWRDPQQESKETLWPSLFLLKG